MIERDARKLGWGVAAVGVYLIVALTMRGAWQGNVRPLYDGLAPPAPYRFAKPPSSLKPNNLPPLPGSGTVRLTSRGSEITTLATEDGQATISFETGSFPARAGQTAVRVTIRPRDPAAIGRPPDGLNYDGNAYAIAATYVPSGKPAPIATKSCPRVPSVTKLCPTVLLRYAFKATDLYRRSGSRWVSLDGTPLPGALSIFGETPALGVFVAVGHTSLAQPSSGRAYLIVLLGTAALAAALGFGRRAQLRRARSHRSGRKRPPR
jgi:hypothetical protein